MRKVIFTALLGFILCMGETKASQESIVVHQEENENSQQTSTLEECQKLSEHCQKCWNDPKSKEMINNGADGVCYACYGHFNYDFRMNCKKNYNISFSNQTSQQNDE